MRKWLKEKRLEAGLTQEKIAQQSNIARTTYAMIEQGERDPSVSVAKNIANALNFNWTIFFDNQLHESRNKEISKPFHKIV